MIAERHISNIRACDKDVRWRVHSTFVMAYASKRHIFLKCYAMLRYRTTCPPVMNEILGSHSEPSQSVLTLSLCQRSYSRRPTQPSHFLGKASCISCIHSDFSTSVPIRRRRRLHHQPLFVLWIINFIFDNSIMSIRPARKHTKSVSHQSSKQRPHDTGV